MADITIDPAALADSVDVHMQRAMRRGRLPGTAVAVVQDGYGTTDLSTGERVNPETTIFSAGGLATVFTATGIMQLVEQGKLDLQTDVNEYLTSIELPSGEFPEPINAFHLLTHTAGFDTRLNGSAARSPQAIRPLAEYLEESLPQRIREPGQVLAHSQHGYGILGQIIADVSGEPYEQYMIRHILDPLGMAHTTLIPPERPAPQIASGYRPRFTGPRSAAPAFPHLTPAAGLATTAGDMAKFMIAMLEGGTFGQQILGDDTRKLMQSQLYAPDERMPGLAPGLFESYFRGQRMLFSTGEISGFAAGMFIFPEQRIGIFIANNGHQSQPITSLLFRIMNEYFNYPAALVVPREGHRQRTDALHGGYRQANHPRKNVEKAGALTTPPLRISLGADGSLRAFGRRYAEISPGWYREVEGDELLAFSTGPHGEQQLVTSFPWEGTTLWTRIAWWQEPLFHQVILGICVLASLAAIAFPVPWHRRHRKGAPIVYDPYRGKGSRTMLRSLGLWNLATVTLYIVGMQMAGPAGLIFGVPWQVDLAGLAALGSAILLLPTALIVWPGWKTGEFREGERAALVVFFTVSILFVVVLGYWNLLGIHH